MSLKTQYFLCSLIDDGKNPDEFTRDVINSCIAKNQITKGKTDAFKVNSCFSLFFFSQHFATTSFSGNGIPITYLPKIPLTGNNKIDLILVFIGNSCNR